MSEALDPRLHAYRADLAAAHLEGKVKAVRFVEPCRMQVSGPSAPVHAAPRADSEMTAEALYGELVDVYEDAEGWAWGQLCDDGYVGYLPAGALAAECAAPTHRVVVPRTFVYWKPDIKSAPETSITLGAQLSIESEGDEFVRTVNGAFVYRPHCAEVGETSEDFVSVAASLLGAPYLWGGKTVGGIDCSGLVQLSCQAAGIACPRDSDMQREMLGTPLETTELSSLQRGDVLFWKGHVGIMMDPSTLLHATANAMLTITEPVEEAVRRIAERGQELLQINRL